MILKQTVISKSDSFIQDLALKVKSFGCRQRHSMTVIVWRVYNSPHPFFLVWPTMTTKSISIRLIIAALRKIQKRKAVLIWHRRVFCAEKCKIEVNWSALGNFSFYQSKANFSSKILLSASNCLSEKFKCNFEPFKGPWKVWDRQLDADFFWACILFLTLFYH